MIWSEKLTNKLTIDPQAKNPTKQRRNNDKEENLMTIERYWTHDQQRVF